jgi:hypothetical protein
MDLDYGTPLGYLKQVSPGVFTRVYTKYNVTMDCNNWTPTFTPTT